MTAAVDSERAGSLKTLVETNWYSFVILVKWKQSKKFARDLSR